MSDPSLSRRAVLRSGGAAGVLGAAVLSGCDLDPTSSSAPPAKAPPDPDQEIVESARAELSTLIAHVAATLAVIENQVSAAGSLVDLHRTQLAALGGTAPSATSRARALSHTQVIAHERRAAHRFTHWALTCDNGDLARVLASVAAGIAMVVQGLTP